MNGCEDCVAWILSGCGGCEMDGCDDCVAWRRHSYWNHPGAGGRRQFIVQASDRFRESVCIPQEAARQLRNLIPDSEPIILEGPDGHMYNVKLTKFGWIYLITGWPEFVDANHIQEGDSILFVYGGSSSFKVHIFSSSGHEISQQPPGVFAPSNHRDCHALDEQVVPDRVHVETSTDLDYTTFPGTCITQEQEKKVLDLAETSMRSEFPLHVAAVNRRNANDDCYVYIPLRLLDNFKEGITIQLEAHGNKMLYSVGASKHGDDQIILQSGLSIFVASHSIKENDLIIFRSKGKARLEVLVLDPSGCEKIASCYAMGNASNARQVREGSVEIVDKGPPQPTAVDQSSDDDEVMGEGYSADETHDRASEVGVGRSQCSYILNEGATLDEPVKKKVEEKVGSILCELPIFVKVLTKSCVLGVGTRCNLVFCKEYIQASLRDRKEGTIFPVKKKKKGTMFLQVAGREREGRWRATVSVRPNGLKLITNGWEKFASENELKVGDVCLFQMRKRHTNTMMVYLIRKSEIESE